MNDEAVKIVVSEWGMGFLWGVGASLFVVLFGLAIGRLIAGDSK